MDLPSYFTCWITFHFVFAKRWPFRQYPATPWRHATHLGSGCHGWPPLHHRLPPRIDGASCPARGPREASREAMGCSETKDDDFPLRKLKKSVQKLGVCGENSPCFGCFCDEKWWKVGWKSSNQQQCLPQKIQRRHCRHQQLWRKRFSRCWKISW